MALWWLGSVFDGLAGLTSVSGPLQQDIWRQAGFDAIPVPTFCSLPQEEVQRIQRNFLGRPVMQHGSSCDEALQQLRSKGYSSWKEYLLQVGKCPAFLVLSFVVTVCNCLDHNSSNTYLLCADGLNLSCRGHATGSQLSWGIRC